MKKTIVIAMSLMFAVSAGIVLADIVPDAQAARNIFNSSSNAEKRTEMKLAREEWKLERQQALENLKQERETLRTTLKQKIATDKCARIQARIDLRESNFGSSKVKHMSVYTNLENRIQKFIDRFQAFYEANKSTEDQTKLAKLSTDLEQLKTDFGTSADPNTATTVFGRVAAFKASYDEYITKLKSARTATCGTTEGDFRATIADTRVYLKTVHDNAAGIREYVRTVILPDLLAVKQDIAQMRGTTADVDENDDSDKNVPTVSITAPADGTTYTAAGTVAISANATSEENISKVEFYDSSTLISTDTAEPYSYDWSVAAANNGTHVWTAKAYDKSDPAKSAVSAAINLIVNIGM